MSKKLKTFLGRFYRVEPTHSVNHAKERCRRTDDLWSALKSAHEKGFGWIVREYPTGQVVEGLIVRDGLCFPVYVSQKRLHEEALIV